MTTNQQEFAQTTKNAGIIGLAAFAGALMGFVLQLIIAYYFGADTETDAFIMAQSTSELLAKLLLGGSITSVFIPMIVERLARNEKQSAWHLGLNIFHLTAAAYVLLIVTIGIFTRPFVNFIAPGFNPEQFTLTVSLLRILLPSFLFLFLAELATSMLHALRVFALPALLRIVAPTVSILFVLLLVRPLGIYSLAIGSVLGSVIQFSIVAYGLRQQGFRYQFIANYKDPAIRKLIVLTTPFIFSMLATIAAGVVYRNLVSQLDIGSLSSLKYAEKITQLLTYVFLNSITLVIYPLLSEKASRRDPQGIKETVASAMRLIVFVTLPLIAVLTILNREIITVAYARGNFDLEDIRMTSIALLFLSIGLTTNGLSSVLGYTVLAFQKTKAAVAITITSQVIAIMLFALLTPLLAHAGLALASSLVPVTTIIMYYRYLKKYIPNLYQIFISSTYAKSMALALVTAVSLLMIQTGTAAYDNAYLDLVLAAAISAPLYFGLAWLWGIPEMQQSMAIVAGKFAKWSGRSS